MSTVDTASTSYSLFNTRNAHPIASTSSASSSPTDISVKAPSGSLKRAADSLNGHDEQGGSTKKRKVDGAAAVGGVANGSGNVESKKKRKKKKRKQSVTSESVNGHRLGHEREHANGHSRADRKKDKSHSATMSDGSGDSGGVSTKGKEREITPVTERDVSVISTVASAAAAQEPVLSSTPILQSATRQSEEETTKLRVKISQQSNVIERHSDLVSSIVSTLTCQICYDPLLRPYTLAPCGHTACYVCLVRWFRSPPAHMQQPQPRLLVHFDPTDQTLLLLDSPVLLRKKKTCPQCRAIVREPPIEARELRSIMTTLRSSTLSADLSELQDDVLERAEKSVPAEPWKGIFAKLDHRNERWQDFLFGPVPAPHEQDGNDVGFGGDRGTYDPEDGVYRCTRCHHEIVGGTCTNCNRLYPGLVRREAMDFFDAFGDDDYGDDDWWEGDEAEFDEDDEFDEHEGIYGLGAFFDRWGRRDHAGLDRRMLGGVESEDEDNDGDAVDDLNPNDSTDEDEESYEGSFIDDNDGDDSDDDDGEVDAMVRRPSRPASRGSFCLTEDEDPEDDLNELPPAPHRRRQTHAIHTSEDENDVENIEDSDEIVMYVRRPRRVDVVDSDGSENDSMRSDELHSDTDNGGVGEFVGRDHDDGQNDEESDDFVPRLPRGYGRRR